MRFVSVPCAASKVFPPNRRSPNAPRSRGLLGFRWSACRTRSRLHQHRYLQRGRAPPLQRADWRQGHAHPRQSRAWRSRLTSPLAKIKASTRRSSSSRAPHLLKDPPGGAAYLTHLGPCPRAARSLSPSAAPAAIPQRPHAPPNADPPNCAGSGSWNCLPSQRGHYFGTTTSPKNLHSPTTISVPLSNSQRPSKASGGVSGEQARKHE